MGAQDNGKGAGQDDGSESRALVLKPIGVVRSPFTDKASAPRQPSMTEGAAGSIELLPSAEYRDALLDLDRFSHVWVLFWFHLSTGWNPRVTPPRSAHKRGLFATRSPYRPNPIGMSVLRLERVDLERCVLHVAEMDLLDGTPVLDIKPYVPYADARLDAGSGWLEDALAPRDPGPRFDVQFSARAEEQLAWLETRAGFDLRAATQQALELGPAQHAYRRIRNEGDRMRIGIKDFRVRFRVAGEVIEVLEIATGYRKRVLDDADAKATERTPLAVHREFITRFGPGAAK